MYMAAHSSVPIPIPTLPIVRLSCLSMGYALALHAMPSVELPKKFLALSHPRDHVLPCVPALGVSQ